MSNKDVIRSRKCPGVRGQQLNLQMETWRDRRGREREKKTLQEKKRWRGEYEKRRGEEGKNVRISILNYT